MKRRCYWWRWNGKDTKFKIWTFDGREKWNALCHCSLYSLGKYHCILTFSRLSDDCAVHFGYGTSGHGTQPHGEPPLKRCDALEWVMKDRETRRNYRDIGVTRRNNLHKTRTMLHYLCFTNKYCRDRLALVSWPCCHAFTTTAVHTIGIILYHGCEQHHCSGRTRHWFQFQRRFARILAVCSWIPRFVTLNAPCRAWDETPCCAVIQRWAGTTHLLCCCTDMHSWMPSSKKRWFYMCCDRRQRNSERRVVINAISGILN